MSDAQLANVSPVAVVREYDRLCSRPERKVTAIRASELGDAARFLRWCSQNAIEEPLHFMWFRFRVLRRSAAGRRGAHPSLARMHSDALLSSYMATQSQRAHERELKRQMDNQHVRSLIPVNNGHEAVRRDYVMTNRAHLCVVQPALSGGYHPHSQFCPACPRAYECARELNAREGFDVVSLRLGRLDAVPERVKSAVAV